MGIDLQTTTYHPHMADMWNIIRSKKDALSVSRNREKLKII